MPSIATLQERLQELHDSAQNVRATAEGEKRDLTPEETRELDSYFAEFDVVKGQVDRFRRLEEQHQELHAPQGRRTEADNPADRAPDAASSPQANANGQANGQDQQPQGRRVNSSIREVPIQDRYRGTDRGTWGWKGMGEFARGVRAACVPGGFIDPRLDYRGQPASFGSEGVDADGGFAVPPDFRATIREKLQGVESLLPRTDQMVTSGNSVTVPVDETAIWDTSSPQVGIQAYWTAEAAQKITSKPALQQVQVSLFKLAVLVPMTDELLEDVPAMDTYLRTKAPDKIMWMVNDAIIRGAGSTRPAGILSAYNNALITVAAESGQPVDTIRYGNILAMWTRLPPGSRARAVWIVAPGVEAQLYTMRFDQASTVPIPVYLPPGGASDAPYSTLLGRPVIVSQVASGLGDVGDIILADLSQYLTVTKGGGVRTDVSIHLWFDYDITAYRFVFRIGGRPWWNAVAQPRTGTMTMSPFVTLAAR
jgi:HK97 family phage major capsid protein